MGQPKVSCRSPMRTIAHFTAPHRTPPPLLTVLLTSPHVLQVGADGVLAIETSNSLETTVEVQVGAAFYGCLGAAVDG